MNTGAELRQGLRLRSDALNYFGDAGGYVTVPMYASADYNKATTNLPFVRSALSCNLLLGFGENKIPSFPRDEYCPHDDDAAANIAYSEIYVVVDTQILICVPKVMQYVRK